MTQLRTTSAVTMAIVVAAIAAIVAASPGCGAPKQATDHDILLAQATGVIDAEPGPTITLPGTRRDAPLPDGPVIRVVIARHVTWGEVNYMLRRIEKAGKRYSLLVGRRRKTRAFVLSDKIEGKSIQLTATDDGKACVSPPGVAEAKCVQRRDKVHISRAFTRELVREAMKGYGLRDVRVHLPRRIQWADVVRVVDAARTCCAKVTMRVEINR